jgi:hypothetical protein
MSNLLPSFSRNSKSKSNATETDQTAGTKPLYIESSPQPLYSDPGYRPRNTPHIASPSDFSGPIQSHRDGSRHQLNHEEQRPNHEGRRHSKLDALSPSPSHEEQSPSPTSSKLHRTTSKSNKNGPAPRPEGSGLWAKAKKVFSGGAKHELPLELIGLDQRTRSHPDNCSCPACCLKALPEQYGKLLDLSSWLIEAARSAEDRGDQEEENQNHWRRKVSRLCCYRRA